MLSLYRKLVVPIIVAFRAPAYYPAIVLVKKNEITQMERKIMMISKFKNWKKTPYFLTSLRLTI